MQCAIISYGIHNRYRHPTLDTENDITSRVPYTYCVTEELSSKCVQYVHRIGDLGSYLVDCVSDLKSSTFVFEDKVCEFIMNLLMSSDPESVNIGILLLLTHDSPPSILD